MNQRASGILLHPTSLYNSYPIGDLGPTAFAFVDFLAKSGQSFWQMLPVGPTGKGDSPYQLGSAFAGNPLLISPDKLLEQGFLRRSDLKIFFATDSDKVDYLQAAYLKLQWLKQAFARFEKKPHSKQQSQFDEFIHTESFWLDDFALFRSLQEHTAILDWTKWDHELCIREPNAIIRAQKNLTSAIRYHQFVQWQFYVQWQELKFYCNSKGVKLIGDVPLFVAHLSSDVWSHPELFKLDASGNPLVIAGVPPDYFSRRGQIWETPVYHWKNIKAQDYSWWIRRLGKAFMLFDINRLDHFIGFARGYEIFASAKTARHGHYRLGPGEAFFKAVNALLGTMAFIAEDLGAITPRVSTMLDQLNIPGMWVLQLKPNLVPKVNSVAYTGTHDNDTTLGWYEKLSNAKRRAWQKQLEVSDQEIIWAIIHKVMASPASIAIIPMQDLLELGTEARMNIPGTAAGNWQWRMRDKVLTDELAQKLLNLTKICGRQK